MYIYGYQIDNKYQEAKIKNLEQSLEFQKYNAKEKKGKKEEKKSQKLFLKNIGIKLITNTKKQKLKIQSRVWNFKNTMLKKKKKKKKEKKKTKTKSQKL